MNIGSSNRWKIWPVWNFVALIRNREWSNEGGPVMSGISIVRRPSHPNHRSWNLYFVLWWGKDTYEWSGD